MNLCPACLFCLVELRKHNSGYKLRIGSLAKNIERRAVEAVDDEEQ